jgi:hypothetical protein
MLCIAIITAGEITGWTVLGLVVIAFVGMACAPREL